MSMRTIRHEVAMMLLQVNEKIAESERKLAGGTLREKVEAAGDLDALQRRKESIEARLIEIDARPEATETLLAWIREEVFNLRVQLNGWLTHGP